MYVNGGYIGSQYGFAPPTANAIGSHLIACLDGAFRDVHLSNTIRHTGEFSPTHETPDNNTIGFWKCDEGAGTTIHDSGPNRNSGSIVGSEYAWIKDVPSYAPDYSRSEVICGMCTDRLGNTIILWKTNRLFAQKLDSTGALMWPDNARSVGVGLSGQDQIALSKNSLGDPFVAWQESRISTGLDICGQWVDAITANQVGTVSVSVQNVPGYGIVGKSVHVSLLDKSNQFLEGQDADSVGVAHLTGIPADTGYSIQVNYVAANPSKIYGNEYWGRLGGISVSGSDTTSVTFLRNAPYTSLITIRNGSTNDLISGSVPFGTPLSVSIEITNPDKPGSVPDSVRCILTLDRDKQAVYDFVGLSAERSVPVGIKDTFNFALTPPAAGIYYHVAAARVKLDGGDVLSEGGQWGSLPTFTVDPPPPSTVLLTVRSDPQSCTFIVDDSTYAGEKSFVSRSGSNHSIETTTPQTSRPGIRHDWIHWSDGDSISHSITTPDTNATYTVSFDTSYYLTTTAGNGGSVGPPSGWFKSGSSVGIAATPNPGWRFSQWIGVGKGSYSGTVASTTIVMDSVILETAAFEPATGVSDLNLGVPTTFVLSGNYPNPSNPSTTIRFGVPKRSSVRITIYSMIGEKVAEIAKTDVSPGYHEVKFDGSRSSSGVYFYRFEAGDFVQTRKLILLK